MKVNKKGRVEKGKSLKTLLVTPTKVCLIMNVTLKMCLTHTYADILSAAFSLLTD